MSNNNYSTLKNLSFSFCIFMCHSIKVSKKSECACECCMGLKQNFFLANFFVRKRVCVCMYVNIRKINHLKINFFLTRFSIHILRNSLKGE